MMNMQVMGKYETFLTAKQETGHSQTVISRARVSATHCCVTDREPHGGSGLGPAVLGGLAQGLAPRGNHLRLSEGTPVAALALLSDEGLGFLQTPDGGPQALAGHWLEAPSISDHMGLSNMAA